MLNPRKSCFIIMPISIQAEHSERYRDGENHFNHVLECLFVPAVRDAGFDPIPPKAKGSDLIQAEIIKNLESSDLVLCDMSALNPNVFFEFGIRTALNKPVCVVKDELTARVPFDTNILNYQEYGSSLNSWDIQSEIARLAEHLKQSEGRSRGTNTLWKYFGLDVDARMQKGEGGTEERLDYILVQLEGMRSEMGKISGTSNAQRRSTATNSPIIGTLEFIRQNLPVTARIVHAIEANDKLQVDYQGELPDPEDAFLKFESFRRFGTRVRFVKISEADDPLSRGRSPAPPSP